MRAKIKGSVLLLSVIISMLVVCLMLLLLPLNNFMFKSYTNLSNERSVHSAISSVLLLVLNNKQIDVPINPLAYKYFENTEIIQEKWGLFELAIISSSKGRISMQKSFLIGQNYFPSTDTLTLSVPNTFSPIFCTGNATISGRIKVPKEGIRGSTIDGKVYTGTLANASIFKTDKDSMPHISRFAKEIINLSASVELFSKDYNADVFLTQLIDDSINVDFADKAVVFHSNESLNIVGANVNGKVIVSSSARIWVDGYSTICDAIIIAPIVIIGEGFTGNLQIFATDTVILNENVHLSYPSVISLNQQRSEKSSFVEIHSNSSLNGTLLVTRTNDALPYYNHPKVNISSNAKIQGLAFVQGLLDVRGKIMGATLAEHFYYKSFSGFYLNYIYDGHILNNMPNEYAIPLVFNNQWKKCLVKALN